MKQLKQVFMQVLIHILCFLKDYYNKHCLL